MPRPRTNTRAHAEYFFHKLLYTPQYYQAIPGCLEYDALMQALTNNPRAGINLRELKAKDFFERGFVVVGSPKTVREQLMDGVKRLRIGHLLALLHFGSMPTELTKREHRPVRTRGAAASRGPVGRRIRGPLVARAPPGEAPGRRHGRRLLSPARRDTMPAPETRKLRLWQNRIETEIEIEGSGPPLVYLHGPWGLGVDRAFVSRLAAAHTVYAPKHPGTSRGDPEAVHALDTWLDLVVYYGELLDAAGARRAGAGWPFLRRPGRRGIRRRRAEIGRQARADRSGRIVARRPAGQELDGPPRRCAPAVTFRRCRRRGGAALFRRPRRSGRACRTLAQSIWAQACTGKFVWPIPDRGLKHRIHRITAPTLILWGKDDRIIAPAYAKEFADRIARAQIALIDRAGHLPQLEQPDATARATLGFLGG